MAQKLKQFVILMLFTPLVFAQETTLFQKFTQIDPAPFADNSHHWYDIFDKSNVVNPMPGRPQFRPDELTSIADNMLLFQKTNGGWPKNYDVFAILTDTQKDSVKASTGVLNTTFDNGSTYNQIAALSNVYSVTKVDKYRIGAINGLNFIIRSQYKNGGWPQYFPLESNYSRCITFNDGAMLGIMELLKGIQEGKPEYSFIDDLLRKQLENAYSKGLECILKTQINDAGRPTAWCQQYDEVSLKPAWARKFEPASICNKESADLVLFLMSIDHPDQKVIDAVQNAVRWFQDSKIYNTRVKTIAAEQTITPFRVSVSDKIIVYDTTAPPIWTRYYELKTHRPIFCNRDSKIVYSLAEVARERRDGYGWYVYGPQQVLDKYPEWQIKWVVPSANKKSWDKAYSIVKNLKEPKFLDKHYLITAFGAVGNGLTNNTAAINAAIEKCNQEGGGRVLVTNGNFLTGPILMKSNVDLHIDANASLVFSTNPSDYLPVVRTRWEGDDCYNYSPLIYANGQHNFAVTGKGTINGQGSAEHWWPWKGGKENGWMEGTPSQLDKNNRPLLKKYNDSQVAINERIMGEGHYLRPQFVNFINCKNVKLEDLTVINSPFWIIHPLLSENIIIRNLTINSIGPNNDGIDPESCKNVLIENCTFNTGDDCIALKSGRDFDGRKANRPIENVIIRNCKMKNGHGGVSIGSEISGGVRNIFVENCIMNSPELERAIRFKTNNSRGGISEGIYFRNLTVGEVGIAVVSIECDYHIEREGIGKYPPLVKNFYVSNLTSKKSTYALWIKGIEGFKCVDEIYIQDCAFSGAKEKNEIENVGTLILQNVLINGKTLHDTTEPL